MKKKDKIKGKIFKEILIERDNQDKKWGEQNHIPLKWCAILTEEVGEVNKSVLENKLDEYRKELIQVCAVAVNMIESLERNPNCVSNYIGEKGKRKRRKNDTKYTVLRKV